MTTLLALFLMPALQDTTSAKYLVNHCYTSGSDSRPNTIQIQSIELKTYGYRVWNSAAWSDTFFNSFEAVEAVYDQKRKCPDAV